MDERDLRKQLGPQIEARRLELKLGRYDVERRAKIASATVSRYESLTALPSLWSLVAMCGPLGCRFEIDENGVRLVPNT